MPKDSKILKSKIETVDVMSSHTFLRDQDSVWPVGFSRPLDAATNLYKKYDTSTEIQVSDTIFLSISDMERVRVLQSYVLCTVLEL